MTDRVRKRQSKKSQERAALASFIDSSGVETMPCSWCFKRNLACRISQGSSRCGECVRRGRSCDGSSVASALTKIMSEQRRVEQEEADAEESLFVLQTQLQTAVGRLARLRRQKRVLKERGSELFRRGMRSLDEMEEEDRRIQSSMDFVASDVRSLGADVPFDWSSLGLDLSETDLAVLSEPAPVVDPGSSGGTPEVSRGS